MSSILITGGSGLLGSAVVDRVRHLGPICLTRRSPVPGVPNVTVDLADEHLGLSRAEYDRLAETAEVIVHCAALTGFRVSRADAMAVNRDGTRNLLRLAERGGAKFVYVSSAFVSRRHHAPADRPAGQPSPWNYLDSKQAAEDVVRDSAAPTAVIRPSVVIGDSRTGRVTHQQGFHTMVEAICRGLLPIIPFPASSAVDFIPQDLAAQAIADIALNPVAAGEYWLTAGPEALTVQQIATACCDIVGGCGDPVPDMPRFASHDQVDRLILPAFSSALPPRLLVKFLGLVAMGRLFGPDRELFPTSMPNQIGTTPPLTREVLDEALAANIRFFWGAPARQPVREGVA